MKKMIALAVAGTMACGLVACGGSSASTAAPAASAPAASAPADSTAEPAAEVSGPLVLYTSMTDGDIEALTEGFNEQYPDVEVEVVNGSGGELTARIVAEAGNPQGDLMWGALSNSDGDTYKDVFDSYLSPYEADLPADYKSTNGFYNLDHLSTVVFCVNDDLEKELGLDIQSYEDLLDPKLAGKIVLADPNESSSAWNNLSNIMAVYGNDSEAAWDYVTKLISNDLVISTSSSVCFKAVADGEYVVGMTYEDGASKLLADGATNIHMVYPSNGTSAFAFGCSVIKGGPNPDAAKAMVDYLMSPEGQAHLGNALGTLRFTNPNAKIESPYLAKVDDVKWVTRDVAWLTENKAEILDHWNQIMTSVKG